MRVLAARVVLLALLAICGTGAGCQRSERPPPSALGDEVPVAGGTAVIALPAEPDVLNSLLTGSSYAAQILALLQDGLLDMGEALEYKPKIAASWSYSADSLAVTFSLRPWNWSDGAQLTARDVVASFDLFQSPVVASPRRGGFADVARATALDARTVRYELRRRRADALRIVSHAIMPAHLMAGLDPADVRSWPLNQHPLSSGPYMLESWDHDRQLVLVRNERYPGPPPLLERVVFRIIPDETARLVELETGGVDFVDEIPPQAAARLAASGQVEIFRVGGRLVGHLQWNLRNPALADRRVRRALSLAIDRSAFVDGLLHGYGEPAASAIPPALWAHDRSLRPDPWDPASARALLRAAGWRDADGDGIVEQSGEPLALTIITRKGDPVREDGLVVIRENLRAVGVAVRPRVLEMGAALEEVRRGRFDGYLGVYQARILPDPTALLRSDATDRFNYGGYANATVDSLMDAALACQDTAQAFALWARCQAIVAEDAPFAFLYYPDNLIGAAKRLRGVRPHLLSPYNNLTEWWIAPAERRQVGAGRRAGGERGQVGE